MTQNYEVINIANRYESISIQGIVKIPKYEIRAKRRKTRPLWDTGVSIWKQFYPLSYPWLVSIGQFYAEAILQEFGKLAVAGDVLYCYD